MKSRFIMILAVVLMALLGFGTAASALSGATANVSTVSGFRGEEITITLTLADPVTIRSGAVSLSYDKTVLELISGEWNISNPTLHSFTSDTEKGVFAYSTPTQISGVVFTARFRILDTAAPGTSDISMALQLHDANRNDMPVTNHPGSVMVICLGDINADGEVNISDAILAAAYFNERVDLTQAQLLAADVNGDGIVNISDAILIAAYFNERIDQFPVAAF